MDHSANFSELLFEYPKKIPVFDHSGLRAGESESEQKMRQCLCAAAQWQAEKTQFIAVLSIRT